jgi:predicted  nucleic acid-binding Zn-ribbon protein
VLANIYNALMGRATSLFRLQELDSQLDEQRSRLEEIRQLLEDSAGITAARRALDSAEQSHHRAMAATSSAEHAAESQREKLLQTEQKLYGGSVQNPKELQDLQQESEALKRHLQTLEDHLLEAMLEAEETELVFSNAKESLQIAQETATSRNVALTEEAKNIRSDIARLEAEREAGLASVAAEDLSLYNDLRRSMGGRAMSLVVEDACSSCGLQLPASVKQAVRSGPDLVRCQQCGRILYLS